jgi:hypothetical protein
MNSGSWSMAFWRACERGNMFDLEQSIQDWRQQMLGAGIKTPVPLVELESHLREEVDQQMRAGCSAQAAFETAVQRIGRASALKVEFEKTSTAGKLLRREYLWIFCFVSAPLLLAANFWALQPGEISPTDRSWGLATISLVALYIGGLPFWYKRLPSPENRLVQTAMPIGYVFALVWPLLATFISLGMIHLKLGIVVEMIIWSVGAAWFATWLAYAVPGEVVS